MHLGRHRDDPDSTVDRSMDGDCLQFEWMKGLRNVVLSNVARERLLGEVIQHVFRWFRRYINRDVVTAVGGVGARVGAAQLVTRRCASTPVVPESRF